MRIQTHSTYKDARLVVESAHYKTLPTISEFTYTTLRMTVLNIHAGGAPAFSLKHKGQRGAAWLPVNTMLIDVWLCPQTRLPADNDSAATIKQRAAKKLNLSDTSDISALYEWHLVRYALDDGVWYSAVMIQLVRHADGPASPLSAFAIC